MSDEKTRTPDESRKMARRYFVKAVVYAAPAVASVVAVNHATAQVSCFTCTTNAGYCSINAAACNAACGTHCI